MEVRDLVAQINERKRQLDHMAVQKGSDHREYLWSIRTCGPVRRDELAGRVAHSVGYIIMEDHKPDMQMRHADLTPPLTHHEVEIFLNGALLALDQQISWQALGKPWWDK